MTGDGAGILFQIPHEFFEEECARLGFTLPEPAFYAVGMVFGSKNAEIRETMRPDSRISHKPPLYESDWLA